MKTFVIAEAGANHNRSWDKATKLIDVAVEARASAVKFQTYSSETLYAKNTPDFGKYKNINKLIKDIELPREWQKDLKKYCDNAGIEFMSTPFDNKAVDELFDIGVKRFKIAGFEATDPRFVRYIAQTQLPLVISAGIGCSLNKIKDIISWVKKENSHPDITILHCNNAYPTPISDICLNQIKLIKKTYPSIKVGLSDHTLGILTPPIAVALGAHIIEKHYTLDRTMDGPDHGFALEPNELKQMISNISDVESSLGIKDKPYTPSEKNMIQAQRSVVAAKNIKKGDVLSVDNLTTMRPFLPNSISASGFYSILEKKAARYIAQHTILLADDILL